MRRAAVAVGHRVDDDVDDGEIRVPSRHGVEDPGGGVRLGRGRRPSPLLVVAAVLGFFIGDPSRARRVASAVARVVVATPRVFREVLRGISRSVRNGRFVLQIVPIPPRIVLFVRNHPQVLAPYPRVRSLAFLANLRLPPPHASPLYVVYIPFFSVLLAGSVRTGSCVDELGRDERILLVSVDVEDVKAGVAG